MLRSIIFEGIDRLGKDTLIKGVKNKLGFFQVVHYQKPETLDCLVKDVRRAFDLPDDLMNAKILAEAQRRYQIKSFTNMIKLLQGDVPFIMNRAHLGEFVYAPRYRGYDGSYIFDLEKSFSPSIFSETTLLVLLHTSSFDFIKDDGLSFDFNKKEEEQIDFIRAFEKSAIKHKLMLDVHDGRGNFVPIERLLGVIIQAFKELPSMNHQIMQTSWYREVDGTLTCHHTLQPSANKIVGEVDGTKAL